MSETHNYDKAVTIIKTAILRSQYDAAQTAKEKQLAPYYGIGKYISMNSRKGFWGKGAIDTISERLEKELPGLRGFTYVICVICAHFTKSGGCWISPVISSRPKTEMSQIWNLQVPKLRKQKSLQFGTCKFQIHRSSPWLTFYT